MTSFMQQIQRGKQASPRRTLLYGTPGIGKSTFAAGAREPIFLQTEDGLGQIECAKFPLASSFADIMTQLGELYTEQHAFGTVVIDSLDWLERLIFAQICAEKNVRSIEDIGYQKGYVFALNKWRDILNGLNAIRDKHNMNVLLVAHAKVEKFANPEGEAYDRYAPGIHKLASAIVTEWCDEVLFASYRVYVVKDDGPRKKTRGIGDGERVVYTAERPAYVAKNRLNLPHELPLDYRAYAHYVGVANGTIATVPEVAPTTPAMPESTQ
jgi:hypothetical protein